MLQVCNVLHFSIMLRVFGGHCAVPEGLTGITHVQFAEDGGSVHPEQFGHFGD